MPSGSSLMPMTRKATALKKIRRVARSMRHTDTPASTSARSRNSVPRWAAAGPGAEVSSQSRKPSDRSTRVQFTTIVPTRTGTVAGPLASPDCVRSVKAPGPTPRA